MPPRTQVHSGQQEVGEVQVDQQQDKRTMSRGRSRLRSDSVRRRRSERHLKEEEEDAAKRYEYLQNRYSIKRLILAGLKI